MTKINCEVNLILALSKNCNISSATRKTKFAITIQNFMFLLLRY